MNTEEAKKLEDTQARAKEANRSMNESRLERMNAIADASEEKRAKDEGFSVEREEEMIVKDDGVEAETRAQEEEARRLQTEGIEHAPNVDETPDPDTKVVNGDTYYRQIVNGAERWQSLKDIRQAAQKVDSADEYLRQAAESVKNATRLLPSAQDVASSTGNADVRKLLRGVALGEEEAINELASVLERRPSETPDVVKTIDQRLSFRTELAQLEERSKDLLANPYTKRLFNLRLQEMSAENPNTGLSEAYASIDKELRNAFPGLTKPSITTQTKLERKRTLTPVPAASQRPAPPEDEDGEEDPADTISKMAKARGVSLHIPRR